MFGQFGLLLVVYLYLKGQKQRTKHLAPDTGRPVTHLVDRPGDGGKDRWIENSTADRGGGNERYCRFWWEGGRENKDHVFTREGRERRNASLEMSQYC